MNDYNEKKDKKGGFLSALSGLLRGGGSAAGGASGFGSAGGAAGGLGGLFATKAGVVGLVLGGATIAAGVGVVYNFIGPSSKPAYSPELFQNSYYEEEASKAGMERAKSRDASAAASSTLDMFRDQAKKDGLGGLASEAVDGEAPEAKADGNASAEAPAADSGAPGAPAGGMPGDGAGKLQAAAGFGSKGGGGGGSGTSIPRMQGGGGGLSGGIGNQFSSVYRPPAQLGSTSGMSASAARVKSSPRYAVPNFNKKGAFGQAKFAGKMGSQARYSSDAGAKGQAGIPFDSSQQTGTGDVGAPNTGSGLGGAGVSNGASLKGNDPSLNSNDSTPPKVPDPENVSPWQKWTDRAMYAMLAATVLILITKVLANFGKGVPWVYKLAMLTAYAAIAAAMLVVLSGMMLMMKYGQKWAGAMYVVTGLMLVYAAYEALKGVGEAATKSGANLGKWGDGCAGYDSNAATQNALTNTGGDATKLGDLGYETKDGMITKDSLPEGAKTINGGKEYAFPDGKGGYTTQGADGAKTGSITAKNNVLGTDGTPKGTFDPKTGSVTPKTAPNATPVDAATKATSPVNLNSKPLYSTGSTQSLTNNLFGGTGAEQNMCVDPSASNGIDITKLGGKGE